MFLFQFICTFFTMQEKKKKKKKTLLYLGKTIKSKKNKLIQYKSTNKIKKLNAKFANEFIWF